MVTRSPGAGYLIGAGVLAPITSTVVAMLGRPTPEHPAMPAWILAMGFLNPGAIVTVYRRSGAFSPTTLEPWFRSPTTLGSGSATSRPRSASPNAAPTESSPTSRPPDTSSRSATDVGTATRSRTTFRCQERRTVIGRSAKCSTFSSNRERVGKRQAPVERKRHVHLIHQKPFQNRSDTYGHEHHRRREGTPPTRIARRPKQALSGAPDQPGLVRRAILCCRAGACAPRDRATTRSARCQHRRRARSRSHTVAASATKSSRHRRDDRRLARHRKRGSPRRFSAHADQAIAPIIPRTSRRPWSCRRSMPRQPAW